MLMTLMVMLALSLLTLSSKSISVSSRDTDLAIARSNARLALSLAIAQLQRNTGPDQRITTTADQLTGSDPDSTSSTVERKHWTGVYKSWEAGVTNRPSPEFLTWLVSGEPADLENKELPQGGGGGEPVELVGKGTLGTASDGLVQVPAMRVSNENGGSARIAWWTGDQGTKAALATPPVPEEQSLAAVRGSLQGAPRNAVEFAEANQQKPFADLELTDSRIPKVTGWNQAAFLASDKEAPQPLFHDLAPFSTGLMTNVRAGGFRKDFSMYLEKSASQAPNAPLYRVGTEPGINESELWLYYNLHKELKTRGRFSYTTGGSMSSSASYFQIEGTMAAALADAEYFYKQPQIVSYQTVVSFQVRSGNRLALVIDPIITYWNPLDVPVVMTPAYNSIKYWQLPYNMKITVGGRVYQTSMRKATGSRDGKDEGAYQYLTLRAGAVQPIVMKPGEVMMVSQGPGTTTTLMTSSLNYVDGRAGWNFGGGYAFEMVTGVDGSGNKQYITVNGNETVTYDITPNSETSGGSQHWSINHHETYYKEDRKEKGESIGIGGVFVDYIFAPPYKEANPKPPTNRLVAAGRPIFTKIKPADTRPLGGSQLATKQPVMIYSYNVKTEKGSDRGGHTLARFNPRAMAVDFSDLSDLEMDVMPYEIQVQPLNSWKNRSLEVSTNGNGFFGGGMNAEFGTSFISTHSVPREPIVSMAAFQHAFANGFRSNAPPDGYAITSVRFPMLPHVSHPIGNSLAPSVIPSGSTQTTLGSRPMADHSYLANQALWDDWFLSGIAPQTSTNFSPRRTQKQVAQEFLEGTKSLPVIRYLPDLGGQEASELLSDLFSGTNPTSAATQLSATLLRVDGLFNVNSTSVEAWKSVLGSLKDRAIVVRDASGGEALETDHDNGVPVAGLLAPQDQIAKGQGNIDVKEPNQWIGRRTLSDEEIESLAKGIVREVRKRGPFLSMADFVNRRVGNNKELARAGAIQSALDSKDVNVNDAYNNGDRAISGTAGNFAFPDAETGPKSYGIPGIVKQADILTPIAPVLSVRSDSFIIRTYGEAVDKDGRILARAWCEAVVERDKNFVDATEKVETAIASLKSEANKAFGRRYQVASFRWLHPEEV